MRPKEVIILNCFELQNFNFTYPGSREKVLKDINVVIPCGQFITVCGLSGCGKTTLLRQFKPALSPHGQIRGNIFFMGRPLLELSQREQAEKIGFVLQNPDNQLVTDKVWHELAFGLESLGYDNRIIRSRVAEMAAFFWYRTVVLPKCRQSFRRTEAIAESGFRYGYAAGCPYTG